MTATVLLLNLPATTLVGVDLLTFTSSPRFQGITSLPAGWHFLFTSPTSSISIRHGTWFCLNADPSAPATASRPCNGVTRLRGASSDLLVFSWSSEKEELVPVTSQAEISRWKNIVTGNDEKGRVLRQGLFPYRQTSSKASPSAESNARDHLRRPDDHNDNAEDFFEDSVDWPLLTMHLSHELLEHFTNPSFSQVAELDSSSVTALSSTSTASVFPCYTLTTASTGAQDRDDIPGLSSQEARDGLFGHEEKDLGYLDIDLKKTWREGAVGRERTEGARDRSWALQDIVSRSHSTRSKTKQVMQSHKAEITRRHRPVDRGGKAESWGNVLLGEMQLTFLAVLTLSNYSCLEEWKRILTLVLTSYKIVPLQPQFFVHFLELLLLELRHCDDVEGGLFDVSSEGGVGEGNLLRGLLRGFKSKMDDAEVSDGSGMGPLDVREKMAEVELWVGREWGWEISDSWVRKGMVQLEDGERVELEIADMEGEDERGEYAPVVVEL